MGVALCTPKTFKLTYLHQTDWTTLAPSILNSYRTAHRLLTSSPYSKPHADLLYKSSPTALRAPSAVHARRRLRDLKHQRRKANGSSATINKPKAKSTDKDKSKELEAPAEQASASTSEHLLKPSLDGTALLNTTTTTSSSSSAPSSPPPPSIAPEYIGKQSPTALATAVRKHFNAQQLVEAETVARFIYVGRQGKSSSGVSRMEGSEGDGMGCWMGSQGREVRRGEGGEVGFRLRFRP